MARQIGSWPLYTIVIALGQVRPLIPHSHSLSHVSFCKMLAANSYQMTLLTGQNYQNNLQLYVLSAVFLAASFVWYTMFRLKPSVYVLSAPWLFYGIAFFLIGVPSLSTKLQGTHTILSDIATWSYAVASAAAFIFFGLNFGEEAVRRFLCRLLLVQLISFFRVPPLKSGLSVPALYKVLNRFGWLPCGTGVAP
jgi:alpha-1,3-glucan synthase